MVSRRRLTWIPSHFVAESNPTPRSAPVSGNAPATARLVAIVTGAGAGIGQALTRELVSRGHTVYAGVRDLKRARGSDLKDIVDRSGLRLVELDVNKPAHVTRVMQQIQKEAGRVDVLVNNAGSKNYRKRNFERNSKRIFSGPCAWRGRSCPACASAGRVES